MRHHIYRLPEKGSVSFSWLINFFIDFLESVDEDDIQIGHIENGVASSDSTSADCDRGTHSFKTIKYAESVCQTQLNP